MIAPAAEKKENLTLGQKAMLGVAAVPAALYSGLMLGPLRLMTAPLTGFLFGVGKGITELAKVPTAEKPLEVLKNIPSKVANCSVNAMRHYTQLALLPNIKLVELERQFRGDNLNPNALLSCSPQQEETCKGKGWFDRLNERTERAKKYAIGEGRQ